MSVLRLLETEHVNKLLSTYPLGIIVRFQHELVKWKKSLNSVDKNITTESIETSSLHTPINEPNVQPPLKQFQLSHDLKVDEILNSSTQGSLILDYYKQNNKLNDGIRSTLVDVLIGHVFSQCIPMSVGLAESIADQIVVMFKSEIKVIIIVI